MHQGTMPHYTQTNHAYSVRSMGTIHSSVPSWVMQSKQFEMRPNRLPTLQTKHNPTQHHMTSSHGALKPTTSPRVGGNCTPSPGQSQCSRGTSHGRNRCPPPASHDDWRGQPTNQTKSVQNYHRTRWQISGCYIQIGQCTSPVTPFPPLPHTPSCQ